MGLATKTLTSTSLEDTFNHGLIGGKQRQCPSMPLPLPPLRP
jgi:hypothetical protein